MKSKITVGVTGGIGSGKSFVCKILESMGYPVFYADKAAKNLLQTNSRLKAEIQNLLGERAYSNTGEINRKYIAKEIFSDNEKLKAMNSLVHPAVRSSFNEFVSFQASRIVFNEAAIIFETGSYSQYQKTILVMAPFEVKMARILNREAITKFEIEARMAKQWSDKRKMKLADYVLQNGKNDMILPQLETILSDLSAL